MFNYSGVSKTSARNNNVALNKGASKVALKKGNKHSHNDLSSFIHAKKKSSLIDVINRMDIRPKLVLGKSNDLLEQEADQMAEKVVNSPQPVSHKSIKRKEEEKKEKLTQTNIQLQKKNQEKTEFVTEVEDVKSIAMLDLEKKIKGKISEVSRILGRRKKLINDALKWKNTDTENIALIAMQSNELNNYSDKIESEACKKLSGKVFKFIREESKMLQKSMKTLVKEKVMLEEEGKEFHRFDAYFKEEKVGALLEKINIGGTVFTQADIKALISQETGDLTNKAVKGLETKEKGITTNIPNPLKTDAPVGIGQMREGAFEEAKKWAESKKIDIEYDEATKSRKELTRESPQDSVKLVTAYIGKIVDYLNQGLPKPKPEGAEFKKLVFAAYNWGSGNVIKSAKSIQKKKKDKNYAYTWEDLKQKASDETRNYVEGIVKRLIA